MQRYFLTLSQKTDLQMEENDICDYSTQYFYHSTEVIIIFVIVIIITMVKVSH